MLTSSVSTCALCTKNTNHQVLVPMKTTTFLLAEKRYNVMDCYKTLSDIRIWAKPTSSNPRICRLCLVNIVRLFVQKGSKSAFCSQCKQQSKKLYTKNSIFLVNGRSIALSAVSKLGDNDSLCFPCCTKPLNAHIRATDQVDGQIANQRAIIIRKMDDSAPPTFCKTTHTVIELNICLNCFKPRTADNLVNMRDIRVTVNDQNVDFIECFQFCTKRVMDSTSLATPMVCLQCMASIVENYEAQHREVEDNKDIKIEPIDSFDMTESAARHLLLNDAEIKTETEDCITTQQLVEPCNDQPSVVDCTTLPQNSEMPEQIEAPTDEEHFERVTNLDDVPFNVAESNLNDLDEVLATVAKLERPHAVEQQSESHTSESANPVPMQTINGLPTNAIAPTRRSRRIVTKKLMTQKREAKEKCKFASSNSKKLKKNPANVANIRCRLCNIYLKAKELWAHNELKHSGELFCDDKQSISSSRMYYKLVETSEEKANKIAAAISDMNRCALSYSQAARLHCIPKSTLHRHHTRKDVKTHGHPPVLGMEFETELAGHINDFQNHLFAINVKDIRRLAYQMAVHNGIPHRFDNETKMAGSKWINGFFSRPVGKELANNRPSCLSTDKLRAFTTENCDSFFDRLNELAQTHQLDASRIYNMDETEFATGPMEKVRVASIKRKRLVPKRISGGHEMDATAVCCANAAGDWHVKPFIIFRRLECTQNQAIGLIEGAHTYGSNTGRIDSELFLTWLQFFIATVRPSLERKVLLVLDGDTFQTKNITANNLAKENGVILLQLPSDCNLRLRPLNASFFKPLSQAYDVLMRHWLSNNPGELVTTRPLVKIFSAAYAQTTNYENAANGFSSTGIWPVDKGVFLITEFANITLGVAALVPEYAKLLKENLEAYRSDGTMVKNVLTQTDQIVHYKCAKCKPTFLLFIDYRKHVLSKHKLVVNDKRLQPWKHENMEKGLDAIKKGWSLRDIEKFYGIPQSTMHRYNKNPIPTGYHRNVVFTLEEETRLVATIREYAAHCFDVTSEVMRRLAFQLAENKQISHPFSVDLQMAGPDWFANFQERHPDIVDFNGASLFSDKLREIIDREKISSSRFFNVDACSFAEVAKQWKRIYPNKNTVASSIVTLVAGFNAAGNFITPFQILKSFRKIPEITETEGQHIEITKTGHFDAEMFRIWLEYFVEETTPSSKKRILLILDNQTVNLASWDFAKAHHVILLALPSTKFCLHPVDLTLFESLEMSFLKLVTSWLEKNNHQITYHQLSQRLTAAYIQTMSRNVAVAGFKDCGLWPLDKTQIDELATISYQLCPLCLEEPSSRVAYEKHMKNEHGICQERPKCPKCANRWFITSSQLERHIWLYHRTSHTCRFCQTTLDRSEFRLHRCGYECHYCRRLIRNKASLLGHFKMCRFGEPVRGKYKSRETKQPYECYCCSEKFKQKRLLKEHFLQQAQEQRHRPLRLRNLTSKRCDQCRQTFIGPRQLNLHIELEHSKILFQCFHCSKKFPTKPGLKQHFKLCSRVF